MIKGDSTRARAAILQVVESQLRSNDPPEAKETYDRLVRTGHSHNEAKRLIAVVLASEIFDVMKSRSGYDQDRYLARLAQLPEMPWKHE